MRLLFSFFMMLFGMISVTAMVSTPLTEQNHQPTSDAYKVANVQVQDLANEVLMFRAYDNHRFDFTEVPTMTISYVMPISVELPAYLDNYFKNQPLLVLKQMKYVRDTI